jgi:hypothetical protein
MLARRLAVALAGCTLLTIAFAQEERKSDKPSAEKKSEKAPGALPRKSDHHHHAPAPRAAEPESDMARMSRTPPPTSGSMPKGPAPKGKLGTEPTAKGKLGTDPKPDESSKPPPRLMKSE